METKEINLVFARNLKFFLARDGITQAELAKRLFVTPATVSDWVNAKKTPRLSKVDMMCSIFGCKRSSFLDESVEKLTRQEQEIIDYYNGLNDRGKEMVLEFIRMASNNSEYKKRDRLDMVEEA